MVKDTDGNVLSNGDLFTFSFGIPPTRVICEVTERTHFTVVSPQTVSPKGGRISDLKRNEGWIGKLRATPND